MASRASNSIYQLKITLEEIRPPIWRRILVKNTTPLDQLHEIIQVVMGWENYHLHSFRISSTDYGVIDPEWGMEDLENEAKFKLNKVVSGENFKFRYTYDFGDGWEHQILLEKILPVDPKQTYPVCIKGKRACPPEDCGGAWGYASLLEALADPQHPEHEDQLEWVGGEWNAESFDLEAVNAALAEL